MRKEWCNEHGNPDAASAGVRCAQCYSKLEAERDDLAARIANASRELKLAGIIVDESTGVNSLRYGVETLRVHCSEARERARRAQACYEELDRETRGAREDLEDKFHAEHEEAKRLGHAADACRDECGRLDALLTEARTALTAAEERARRAEDDYERVCKRCEALESKARKTRGGYQTMHAENLRLKDSISNPEQSEYVKGLKLRARDAEERARRAQASYEELDKRTSEACAALESKLSASVQEQIHSKAAADALDRQLICARDVLLAVGVKATDDDGHLLMVAERIAILARRSTPHEDPRRTAYVAGLERENKAMADKLARVLEKLRILHAVPQDCWLEWREEAMKIIALPPACVTSDHRVLTDAGWKPVSEVGPPDAVVTDDGPKKVVPVDVCLWCGKPADGGSVGGKPMCPECYESGRGAKPPSDPVAVGTKAEPDPFWAVVDDLILASGGKTNLVSVNFLRAAEEVGRFWNQSRQRGVTLAEIDAVLQPDYWVGGRLDSIKALIADAKVLKGVEDAISRNYPDISIRVKEGGRSTTVA